MFKDLSYFLNDLSYFFFVLSYIFVWLVGFGTATVILMRAFEAGERRAKKKATIAKKKAEIKAKDAEEEIKFLCELHRPKIYNYEKEENGQVQRIIVLPKEETAYERVSNL